MSPLRSLNDLALDIRAVAIWTVLSEEPDSRHGSCCIASPNSKMRPVKELQDEHGDHPSAGYDVFSYPAAAQEVLDLFYERGIEISREIVRSWWQRFVPIFAAEIHKKRAERPRSGPQLRLRLDGMIVKIDGERHFPWRAAQCEGEVLDNFVKKNREVRVAGTAWGGCRKWGTATRADCWSSARPW